MLHGLGESSRLATGDSRTEHRYEVIVIDLPGFCRSPALPTGVVPTAAHLAVAVELRA